MRSDKIFIHQKVRMESKILKAGSHIGIFVVEISSTVPFYRQIMCYVLFLFCLDPPKSSSIFPFKILFQKLSKLSCFLQQNIAHSTC